MQNQAFEDDDTALIVVMGATGSGKTTFINVASGQTLGVGYSLQSCTSQVQPTEPFEIAGRKVRLIDTPGFDDTTMSDADILKLITVYLSATYREGKKPSGIVYMHDVTAKRFTGTSRRNLYMLRKFCGDETVKNVVLVTNMWEGVESEEKGAARELELKTHFRSLLDLGAGLHRHYNTRHSAMQILLPILRNVPEALHIQKQIVDDKIELENTDAGSAVLQQLQDRERKHQLELAELRLELERVKVEMNKEMQEELQAMRLECEREIAQTKADRENLSSDFRMLEERIFAGIQEARNNPSGDCRASASGWGVGIEKLEDGGSGFGRIEEAFRTGRDIGVGAVGFGVGVASSGLDVAKGVCHSAIRLIWPGTWED